MQSLHKRGTNLIRSNVFLSAAEKKALTETGKSVKKSSGKAVSAAQVLRAILDGVFQSGVDLSKLESTGQITRVVRSALYRDALLEVVLRLASDQEAQRKT